MEKLIYDSWILEAYFTENYYPKEIGHLIILLEINLHQIDIDCNCSHCFFSHDNKIYFHTATDKANIDAAKSLLIYPENKYATLQLNYIDWLDTLQKITQTIICIDYGALYLIYEKPIPSRKINHILGWYFSMSAPEGVWISRRDLDKILSSFAIHNYIVILSKPDKNLLYPVSMHFPTFHVHM